MVLVFGRGNLHEQPRAGRIIFTGRTDSVLQTWFLQGGESVLFS